MVVWNEIMNPVTKYLGHNLPLHPFHIITLVDIWTTRAITEATAAKRAALLFYAWGSVGGIFQLSWLLAFQCYLMFSGPGFCILFFINLQDPAMALLTLTNFESKSLLTLTWSTTITAHWYFNGLPACLPANSRFTITQRLMNIFPMSMFCMGKLLCTLIAHQRDIPLFRAVGCGAIWLEEVGFFSACRETVVLCGVGLLSDKFLWPFPQVLNSGADILYSNWRYLVNISKPGIS